MAVQQIANILQYNQDRKDNYDNKIYIFWVINVAPMNRQKM